MANNSLPTASPEWRGDLDDDCLADWGGLLLHAEWMQGELWFWAVYDPKFDYQVVTSDHNKKPCRSGEQARREAENAALAYLRSGLPSG